MNDTTEERTRAIPSDQSLEDRLYQDDIWPLEEKSGMCQADEHW